MQAHQPQGGTEQATTPIVKARAWIEQNALVLDTETTGLDETAEIVEVSLIDCHGTVLMNTFVRPNQPIPEEASAIHGITDAMVSSAPSWLQIRNQFFSLVSGRPVVIYNADYDTRIILQTDAPYGLPLPALDTHCAMLTYAEHWGQWDERRNNWKWQRLTAAAEQQGVRPEGQAHRALADCRMTLGIIRAMAQEVARD